MFKEILAAIEGIPAKISALVGDIKAISAQLATANATIAERDAEIIKLKESAAATSALQSTIAERDTTIAAHVAEIAAMKASGKTIEQQATEQVAALGIDPLPAAGAGGTKGDDVDALRVHLAKETDPARKMEIARKLREARGIDFN